MIGELTTDDGSCIYDNDGDGVLDSLEIVGCQDTNACNYDETATDSGECSFAQDGYDCDGNLLIYVGAEAHGGIVFHYDSINDYGFVMANENYCCAEEWGCYGTDVNGAYGQFIGTGYQNTLDIINQGCLSQNGGLIAAEITLNNNYNDWYLPSQDEMEQIYFSLCSQNNENAICDGQYWTSTQVDENDAVVTNMGNGISSASYKHNSYLIRPIRTFGNILMGCMDESACNYNSTANMVDTSCEYPEQGFDCYGNFIVQVGDEGFGGLVFYVDELKGFGLVAAEPTTVSLPYGCNGTDLPNANGFGIGWGKQNTDDILNACDERPIAASACDDYEINGYDDWFLPSAGEFQILDSSIGVNSVNNPLNVDIYSGYKTSTEIDATHAYMCHNYGNGVNQGDKGSDKQIPIRAFGNIIYGCIDSIACNYNPEANMANSTLCEYPQLGYDCEENITEYVIGMEAEGGIVFYVDETGQHGLVGAMEDLDGGYEWGCYLENVFGAGGTSISTGYQNTMEIVNQGCSTEYGGITAAEATVSYESDGYSDWYLPSIDELVEMYNTIGNGGLQGNVGGFEVSNDPHYWSSSEQGNISVWFVYFSTGNTNTNDKYAGYKVRPIRTF
jgi:hypothetical protein